MPSFFSKLDEQDIPLAMRRLLSPSKIQDYDLSRMGGANARKLRGEFEDKNEDNNDCNNEGNTDGDTETQRQSNRNHSDIRMVLKEMSLNEF
mmetsp:Transcript_2661/g.4133  ORF Transcript_2661/g.4133 Transcript_2661/m.4133 type:complete len:92 (+) Transcript_2661:444-719(+)